MNEGSMEATSMTPRSPMRSMAGRLSATGELVRPTYKGRGVADGRGGKGRRGDGHGDHGDHGGHRGQGGQGDRGVESTPVSAEAGASHLMKSVLEASHTPTNDVGVGGYVLSPARGVLSGEGSETFTVTYAPYDLSRGSYRAVMMLRNVPQAAYPTGRCLRVSVSICVGVWVRAVCERGCV